MSSSILVLDANIIIRAVLGRKVRDILIEHSGKVEFFTPDVCVNDAENYLPIIFENKKLPVDQSLIILNHIKNFLQIIDHSVYEQLNKVKSI